MTYCPYGCVNGYIETDSRYGTQCPEHAQSLHTLRSAMTGTMEKILDLETLGPKVGSYDEYLQTDHWYRKRRHILVRADYRCESCGKGDRILDVHHRTYENKGWEHSDDLIALCRDCHARTHGKTSA